MTFRTNILLDPSVMRSFGDEMTKIAAKVPFLHGTHHPFKELLGGVGKSILRSDPNPRGVYLATKTRKALPGVKSFAHKAVESRGGEPTVLSGKMDTKKGWRPFNVKPGSSIDLDEARDLTSSLDATAGRKERGKIWKQLNQSVGSWHNPDSTARLKTTKSRMIK